MQLYELLAEQTMSNDTEASLQQIAENAQHDSVTVDNLKLKKTGLIFKKNWLSNPVISYLNDSEQPHVLFRTRDSVSINGESAGQSGYGAVLVITDERFLFLIGQENNDRIIQIPVHSAVEFEFEPSTYSQNQSLLETNFNVKFWLGHESGEIGISPSESLGYGDIWAIAEIICGVSRRDVTWVGKQWWVNRTETHDRLYDLSDDAQSDTVNPHRLEPIFSHLHERETPEWILKNRELSVGVLERDSDDTLIRWQQEGHFDWTVITSERILIAIEDETEELAYSVVDSVGVKVVEQYNEYTEEYEDIPYFHILVDDFVYFVEADELTDSDLRRAIRYMRDQIY